jgi:hypothetical protein
MLTYADVCWRMLTHAPYSCMPGEGIALHYAYAVCWRMLTYADVCWRMPHADVCRMLTYAACWRMLHADVCRMLT